MCSYGVPSAGTVRVRALDGGAGGHQLSLVGAVAERSRRRRRLSLSLCRGSSGGNDGQGSEDDDWELEEHVKLSVVAVVEARVRVLRFGGSRTGFIYSWSAAFGHGNAHILREGCQPSDKRISLDIPQTIEMS